MSSSPSNEFPGRVFCPFQLSEEAIASFPPELPSLDESRLSLEQAAFSAEFRNRFMSASSDAQSLMRSMRKAWMQWHRFPVIPSGQLFVSVLL
jgi:hypothetical protein